MKLWVGRSMTKLEELKAMVSVLQRKIEALEKPKQWEPRKFSKFADTVAAACAMNTQSRLLAYVDEFGGDWEADWEAWKQEKCYVCLNSPEISQKWKWSRAFNTCMGGTVYMSRDCAEGLAAKLNSGEVVL